MPIKRRKYNTRLIKVTLSYNIQEITQLFNVHKNTVREWLKDGLPKIDGKKPFMIHGSELKQFLDDRQRKRKQKLQDNQMMCFTCKKPSIPKKDSIKIVQRTTDKINIKGKCITCGGKMNRAGTSEKREEYLKNFGHEPPLESHIKGSSAPTVNCHFEKEEKHDEKTDTIQSNERTHQTDLFSILEGSKTKSGHNH